MTTALARVAPTGAMALEPMNMGEAIDLAARIKKASLCPAHLRTAEDVLLVVMRGRELGLSAMQSVSGMYVISGKVALYADLMVGIIKNHADCKYFRLISSDGNQATYETLRAGDPEPTRLTYTMAQASAAGLTSNQTYKRHPDAMLRARCAAALGRIVYPDKLIGVYDRSELEESDDAPPIVANVTPARPVATLVVTTDGEVIEAPSAMELQLQDSVAAELEKKIRNANLERSFRAVYKEVKSAEGQLSADRLQRLFVIWAECKEAWKAADAEEQRRRANALKGPLDGGELPEAWGGREPGSDG